MKLPDLWIPAALLAAGLGVFNSDPVAEAAPTLTYAQCESERALRPIQEDESCWDAERDGNGIAGPGWDCATMGDRICPPSPTQVPMQWRAGTGPVADYYDWLIYATGYTN